MKGTKSPASSKKKVTSTWGTAPRSAKSSRSPARRQLQKVEESEEAVSMHRMVDPNIEVKSILKPPTSQYTGSKSIPIG